MDERATTELVNELWDSLYSPLLRYAVRACGRMDMAEDVVQEVFMKLYRALREGQAVQNPRAWAYTIVRHDIGKRASAYRRFGASHESVEVLESVAAPNWQEAFRGHEKDELNRLLQSLTPREEEVVLLRIGALKYREIAAELHISTQSVFTLLTRSLRKLRVAMGNAAPKEQPRSHAGSRPPKTLQ